MRLIVLLLLAVVRIWFASAQPSTDLTTFASDASGFVAVDGSYGLRGAVFIGKHNNDSFDDVAVGGSEFVVVLYGGHGPWDKVNLNTFQSGPLGYKIFPSVSASSFGTSVGAAGDVNHDGYEDVIIGESSFSLPSRAACGAAHVVFGQGGTSGDLYLSNLFVTGNGFTIIGPSANSRIGLEASSVVGDAGDLDNDGFDEILVSDPSFNVNMGCAWIVKGRASNFTDIDLANLGARGYYMQGKTQGGAFGASMAPLGDVNGDGIDDVVYGEQYVFGGRAYVILGSSSFSGKDMNLFTTGSTGVLFLGPLFQSYAGTAVLGPGDINGDGFDDIVINVLAYINIDPYKEVGQRIFVLYGASVLPATDVVLALPFSSLGMAGFSVYNPTPFNGFGKQLSKAGDINTDGIPDILVSGNGVVYILFGGVFPTNSSTDITSTYFWKFSFETPVTGPAPAVDPMSLGTVVHGGQDFSGDGVPDVLLGATGQYVNTFVYMLKGPFDAVPTVAPTVVPTFAPTATPSTAPPTLVPSAAPTYLCVQWTLGEVGQTCSETCAATSPARVCSDAYFEDILTAEGFESMVSAAVDGRSASALRPNFCSGGTDASPTPDAARAVTYIVRGSAGDVLRTYCTYATSASSTSGCDSTSDGFYSRKFCPCVHNTCDVVPWFLGYSGESCTDTCAHVGRVCDGELTTMIADGESFRNMVGTATSVVDGAAVGSPDDLCSAVNAPTFAEPFPAVVAVNVPGGTNYTFCSHAVVPAVPTSGDCDAAISSVPAQRFCPCKYGRKLTAVQDVSAPVSSANTLRKFIGALPYLRGAGV